MKAYDARDIAYRNNKLAKGRVEIDALIKAAATYGKFQLVIRLHNEWGDESALRSHYVNEGFKAYLSHEQTIPNDGDTFLHLNWAL